MPHIKKDLPSEDLIINEIMRQMDDTGVGSSAPNEEWVQHKTNVVASQKCTPIEKQRVCVIGGGPSGTAVLRAFKSAADKGQKIPEVVCFEKQSDVGGQWIYNWRVGLDEHQEPVASAMYRYLWSNGPKECLEFADYTFLEHFKQPIPSYPPREVVHDYIKGRIEKANVMDWVQLNTVVHDVKYEKESGLFHVASRHLSMQEATITECREEHHVFDYVFCCVGHYSKPNVPYFPGFERFEGRILHGFHFKDACEFADSRILIVGTSYSAEDIASQCYKYGCKDITCSFRTKPMPFHWPAGFQTRPLLERVEGKTATFIDGSKKDIDAIILCTGYIHHVPFLEESLQLKTRNRLWIDDCYKGIFWERNPRLMYIGMQDQWLTFNMFDAQAWLARDFVLGTFELPSAEEQAAHFKQWREREEGLQSDEDKIRFQTDYTAELVEQTDYPSFDYEGVTQAFLAWEHSKHEDIMAFRDKPHTSVMDGTVAAVHHTPWLQALDDSKECYLGTKKESK